MSIESKRGKISFVNQLVFFPLAQINCSDSVGEEHTGGQCQLL